MCGCERLPGITLEAFKVGVDQWVDWRLDNLML